MNKSKTATGSDNRLILTRTHRDQIREGIMVITKGEGVRVFDQDGKSYTDLVAGVTRPVHAGYGRKEIAQAAYDQMCELSYFTPMEFANPPAIKLADVLSEITRGGRFYYEQEDPYKKRRWVSDQKEIRSGASSTRFSGSISRGKPLLNREHPRTCRS